MSSPRRATNSVRTTQTAPITGPYATFSPPPPFRSKTKLIQTNISRSPGASLPSYMKEETELICDRETLKQIYLALKQEKAELQCELKPMRQKYQVLQDTVLTNHRVLRNPNGIPIEDTQINVAVTTGDFSAAILQLNQESALLREQYLQAKGFFSPSSLQILKNQIEESLQSLHDLQISLHELEQEIFDLEMKKNNFQHSNLFGDVQVQTNKMTELSQKLEKARQLHSRLKADHYVLTGGSDEVGVQDDSTLIMRLNHRLDQVRRAYSHQCDQLIQKRDKQLQEIQEMGKALSVHTQTSAAKLQTLQSNQMTENSTF